MTLSPKNSDKVQPKINSAGNFKSYRRPPEQPPTIRTFPIHSLAGTCRSGSSSSAPKLPPYHWRRQVCRAYEELTMNLSDTQACDLPKAQIWVGAPYAINDSEHLEDFKIVYTTNGHQGAAKIFLSPLTPSIIYLFTYLEPTRSSPPSIITLRH